MMFMIMSGGLGFMVWVEIGEYRKKHRLSLQAKVVLSFSVHPVARRCGAHRA